jgi:hypothetical protein
MDWQLSWQPLKDAKGYRVEVGNDRKLDVLLWEQVVVEPRVNLPDLNDGSYWVRIRGVDSQDLEGNSVIGVIVLDRHPQPPQSLNPGDGELLRGGPIELQWSAVDQAHGYRLEVAIDQAFEDIIVKVEIEGLTHYRVMGITKPGSYYWRVSAISGAGELGPAGVVRFWQLRPTIDPPELSVTAGEEVIVASWQKLNPECRYHVQLAHDAQFKQIELDQIVTENNISFAQIYSQLRHLRVSVVEADGYQGPWSSVHKIDPLLGVSVWVVPASLFFGLLLF